MTPWPGCRVATANASYWHAAYDFATRTLCGVGLTGMGEHRVTNGMEIVPPLCCRVRRECG